MKKHLTYTLFFLVLIIFSCQKLNKSPKPEQLIAKDKMVEILTDIAFVKAAKGSYKKVFDIEKINAEAYILEKHGIDSLVFSENNNWYTGQLETYEEIFNKVKKNLEVSKTKFEKLKKKEDSIKKVKDSIRRAEKAKNKEKKGTVIPDELDFIDEESIEEDIENAVNKKTSKFIPRPKKKKQ